MVQKKRSKKTAEELQTERVTTALEETDRTGRAPAFIRENPGQFLRDMYDVWHRQGGKEGGRWRNSIRKMREEWLTGRNHVPSLHPKLMGRVKVTRSDARALVGLFLERWRYAEDGDAMSSMASDGYVRFASGDHVQLRKNVLSSLIKPEGRTASLLMPEQGNGHEVQEETQERWSNIERIVHECDALITLSRHKIAVGPGPWQTISNVWHQLNELWLYDRQHERADRLFIWVIDLGSRDVEEAEAFEEYFNSGLLALQLASFSKFDALSSEASLRRKTLLPTLSISESPEREDRWQWLAARTAVIAQNIRWEELDESDQKEDERLQKLRLKDIGVTAEHVLPSTTPRAWGHELRRLYRREIAASDATFTVFLREDPWTIGDRQKSVRYFAHTPLQERRSKSGSRSREADWRTDSKELQAPHESYDHGFRLTYWAARHRLGMLDEATSDIGWEALAYLRKIGFRVLRLPTFLKVFSTQG